MANVNWYGVTQFVWLLLTLGLISFEGHFVFDTSIYPLLSLFAIILDSLLAVGGYVTGLLLRSSNRSRVWRERVAVDQMMLSLKLLVPIFYFVDLVGQRKAVFINGLMTLFIVGTLLVRTILFILFCYWEGDPSFPVDAKIVGQMELMYSKYNPMFKITLSTGYSTDYYSSLARMLRDQPRVEGRPYVIDTHMVYGVSAACVWTFGLIVVASAIAVTIPEIDSRWYGFQAYLLPMYIYGLFMWPYDQHQRIRRLNRCYQIAEPTIVYLIPLFGFWATAILTFVAYGRSYSWAEYIPLLMPLTISPVVVFVLIGLLGICIPGADRWAACCSFWWESFKTEKNDQPESTDVEIGRPM